jgi:2-(1,2-epoxy-1,2-dihydrophenyl)acetyl-CoA isomerase
MDILLRDQSESGVLTLTLNRPERKNAIDLALAGELVRALEHADQSPAVRAVVLRGAGDGFCSGGDLVGGDDSRHVLGVMRQIHQPAVALHRFSKPTIACVHGVAAGAGWNLVLGCDLVVAADDARFCQIFIRRGLSLDYGGSWLLPRLVGLHRAKELALLGGFLSAAQAQAWGLVNRIAPRAELDAAVAEWAQALASGPPVALAQSKRLLQESDAQSFEGAIENECAYQCVNLATEDTREGFRAFFEKRKPSFRGR